MPLSKFCQRDRALFRSCPSNDNCSCVLCVRFLTFAEQPLYQPPCHQGQEGAGHPQEGAGHPHPAPSARDRPPVLFSRGPCMHIHVARMWCGVEYSANITQHS